MPGTPDANPRTQISFLGVPAAALHDIVVDGSRTHRHSGTLEVLLNGHRGELPAVKAVRRRREGNRHRGDRRRRD